MKCSTCGKERTIARTIGICIDCIRDEKIDVRSLTSIFHKSRTKFGLPKLPPKSARGLKCNLCSNECALDIEEIGYCGLRKNVGGRIEHISTSTRGLFFEYLDPHVTNCCSSWFCPGGTGRGFPRYAYKEGPEYGYYNMAVFLYGCNFDCLFCQNYEHKNFVNVTARSYEVLAGEILENERVSCVCFFGGSPEPQLPFCLSVSRKVIEEKKRIVRICYEWNGCGNSKLVKEAAETSFVTGGNIKFDLKFFNENLSLAVSGVSNKLTFENFKMIAEEFWKDYEVPILTATTLLVPGYVDELEVENIAKFISSLSEDIPYSLLVFYPCYEMSDLPVTPLKQVVECYTIAKRYLKNVRVGNLHLLEVSMKEIEELSKRRLYKIKIE